MPPVRPSLHLSPRTLVTSLARWPVESQTTARRNALVASTELTDRRREREEVEEFLARRFGTVSSTATGLPLTDITAGEHRRSG